MGKARVGAFPVLPLPLALRDLLRQVGLKGIVARYKR